MKNELDASTFKFGAGQEVDHTKSQAATAVKFIKEFERLAQSTDKYTHCWDYALKFKNGLPDEAKFNLIQDENKAELKYKRLRALNQRTDELHPEQVMKKFDKINDKEIGQEFKAHHGYDLSAEQMKLVKLMMYTELLGEGKAGFAHVTQDALALGTSKKDLCELAKFVRDELMERRGYAVNMGAINGYVMDLGEFGLRSL